MSRYVQNYQTYGSSSQGPAPLPDNAYDRAIVNPGNCTTHKTPNSVLITRKLGAADRVGFFFGSSASFAAAATTEGIISSTKGSLSGSGNFSTAVSYADGTVLNIHPTAWSGSAADVSDVVFVYKGGLDGQGRP